MVAKITHKTFGNEKIIKGKRVSVCTTCGVGEVTINYLGYGELTKECEF